MPQPTTGIFQTITAAASAAAGSLKYANSFIPAIWWDTRPVAETPYTTLQVNIPTVDEGKVSDIGSGPLNPSDPEHGTVSVPYDKHFSTSFVIKSFDQKRSAQDLAKLYFAPRLEALKRQINRTICGLITTTNFANYSIINGAGADTFARADLSSAWANLVNAGVPVEDVENLFFLTSPTAWSNMVADANFINQYIVGQSAAVDAQQAAKLQLMLGATPKYDQHFGQQKFSAGKEPAILMHRYAISGVTSPPPPTDTEMAQIQESITWIGNDIPVQVQSQYQLKDQGILIHLHCYWGVAVSRPDFGSVLQSA